MSPKPIREILRGPFAEWLGKDDWRPWSAFLCGLLGEPLTHYETAIYRRCTGRQKLPDKPFREAWVAVGLRVARAPLQQCWRSTPLSMASGSELRARRCG